MSESRVTFRKPEGYWDSESSGYDAYLGDDYIGHVARSFTLYNPWRVRTGHGRYVFETRRAAGAYLARQHEEERA